MDALQVCRWHEYDSRISLEQAARRFILEAATQAISARGIFSIVLSGGNSPRNIYRSLCAAETHWPSWHVYFSDERCLPPGDAERNSCMAHALWLDHVDIPSVQIHTIRGEMDPETAAAIYQRELSDVGEFDLVILGVGEDGHTASLFPGRDWEGALPTVFPVYDSPKPPRQRVTLSPERLSRAKQVIFLAGGDEKREAIINWRAGKPLPASRITPRAGVDVFYTREAIVEPAAHGILHISAGFRRTA